MKNILSAGRRLFKRSAAPYDNPFGSVGGAPRPWYRPVTSFFSDVGSQGFLPTVSQRVESGVGKPIGKAISSVSPVLGQYAKQVTAPPRSTYVGASRDVGKALNKHHDAWKIRHGKTKPTSYGDRAYNTVEGALTAPVAGLAHEGVALVRRLNPYTAYKDSRRVQRGERPTGWPGAEAVEDFLGRASIAGRRTAMSGGENYLGAFYDAANAETGKVPDYLNYGAETPGGVGQSRLVGERAYEQYKANNPLKSELPAASPDDVPKPGPQEQETSNLAREQAASLAGRQEMAGEQAMQEQWLERLRNRPDSEVLGMPSATQHNVADLGRDTAVAASTAAVAAKAGLAKLLLGHPKTTAGTLFGYPLFGAGIEHVLAKDDQPAPPGVMQQVGDLPNTVGVGLHDAFNLSQRQRRQDQEDKLIRARAIQAGLAPGGGPNQRTVAPQPDYVQDPESRRILSDIHGKGIIDNIVADPASQPVALPDDVTNPPRESTLVPGGKLISSDELPGVVKQLNEQWSDPAQPDPSETDVQLAAESSFQKRIDKIRAEGLEITEEQAREAVKSEVETLQSGKITEEAVKTVGTSLAEETGTDPSNPIVDSAAYKWLADPEVSMAQKAAVVGGLSIGLAGLIFGLFGDGGLGSILMTLLGFGAAAAGSGLLGGLIPGLPTMGKQEFSPELAAVDSSKLTGSASKLYNVLAMSEGPGKDRWLEDLASRDDMKKVLDTRQGWLGGVRDYIPGGSAVLDHVVNSQLPKGMPFELIQEFIRQNDDRQARAQQTQQPQQPQQVQPSDQRTAA